MVLPVQKTIETRFSVVDVPAVLVVQIFLSAGPDDRHHGRYGSKGQLCLASFAGDDTARAVFPVKGLDVPVVCNVRCWPCLCSTVEVSAVAVHRPAGETSTEAPGRIYSIFYVNVYFDPEVDSRRGNPDIICTSRIWQLRQLQRLLDEFLVFLYVKVDSFPEVDFGLVPARFAQGNLDIIFMSFLMTSEGDFAAFCGIFRTPSAWT